MNYEEYTAPDGPWTQIDGWNDQGVFTAIEIIHNLQRVNGIIGNIGEIGVHEGQMFCALDLLTDPKVEGALAIDVFDDQHRNIDNSGGAPLKTFEKNLDRMLGDRQMKRQRMLHIVKKDSLQTDSLRGKIKTSGGFIGEPLLVSNHAQTDMFRLFSIDGGHTVIHVLNDLHLVENAMVLGGVVIVDDYMHPKWPGVTEGLHIYCADRSSRLVPFAYGNGKMYLTTFDWVDRHSKSFNLSSKINGKLREFLDVELFGRKLAWVEFE